MDTSSILRTLGIKNVGEISTTPNYFFAFVLPFSALLSGATVERRSSVPRSKTFVVDNINGTAQADLAVSPFLAGYPLSYVATGVIEHLNRLDVQFFSTRGDWQDNFCPWPTLIGTSREPYIPMFRPVLGSGSDIGVRVRNNSSVAVSGSIVLIGRLLDIKAAI